MQIREGKTQAGLPMAALQPQRRRSPRTTWRIPVIVTWKQKKAMTMREEGETEVVNAHGALIKLSTHLLRGEIIRIMRPGGTPSKFARVVTEIEAGPDGSARLGVELDTPGLEFWVELAR